MWRVALTRGPAWVPLVQLRPGRAQNEQRHSLRPLGQMLQEREQRLVRPVQVLEHQHGLPGCGQSFEVAPPGREQLLSLRRRGRLHPDQRGEPLQQPLSLRLLRGDRRVQLRRRHLRRVRLEDPRLRLDDLPQRPERDPLPIRKAAPLPPAGQLRLRPQIGEQLRDQPALAHPRLADDRDQLHRALLRRPLERPDQKRLLQLPADQRRRVPAGDVGPEPGAGRLRPPQRQRLRLPLHRHRLERLVLEHPLRRPIGLLTDRDPAHRRRALDPSSRVHDVAGDEPLALLRTRAQRDHRLTRVDPHPHLQLELGIGLVQAPRSPPESATPPAPPAPHRPRAPPAHRTRPSPHRRRTSPPSPRSASISDRNRAWYGRIRARTSSGSCCSDAAVKPTRSQNNTDTTFRSSSAGVGAVSASGAPQNGQNGNSPGSSLPQAGQDATCRV